MTNNIVRAAAEGMPYINRRTAVLGACAAAAALAASSVPAPAAPAFTTRRKMSPELRAVIKAHKAAFAYFQSVCDCCDTVKLGREATDAEEAKWHAASNAEHSAMWDVCRFPARTTADIAAKGRHLKKFHYSLSDLQAEHVEALLLSMAYVEKGGGA